MNNIIFDNFDRLRIPLMVMVVFIHAQFSLNGDSSHLLYDSVSTFFTSVVSSVAVPLFFVISGCLYFRNYKEFTKDAYLDKQRRRCHTLLIPYVVWNSVLWLLFSAFMLVAPSLLNGGIPSLVNVSLKDIIFVYWIGPLDFPLWFIRDLIMVTILSPVIYLLLFKRTYICYAFIIGISLLWLTNATINIFGNDMSRCILFFSIGVVLNKFIPDSQSFKLPKYIYILGGG